MLSRYWRAKLLRDADRWDEAVALIQAVYEDSVRAKVTRYPLARESAKLAAGFQERLGNAEAAKAWRAKQGG